MINGEAGIGSRRCSSMLALARAKSGRAPGAVGVESEAELAFAGMHQLLQPIIGARRAAADPAAQRSRRGVRGRSDLEPDPFLVALAAHQLVCGAAEARPVALIVDDAHWLDRSTLGVLSFIARRLEGESVVLIVAVRDGYMNPFREARLPSLRLERLERGSRSRAAGSAAHLTASGRAGSRVGGGRREPAGARRVGSCSAIFAGCPRAARVDAGDADRASGAGLRDQAGRTVRRRPARRCWRRRSRAGARWTRSQGGRKRFAARRSDVARLIRRSRRAGRRSSTPSCGSVTR